MAAVRLHAVTLLACCLWLLGCASGLPRSQSPTISWNDAASVIGVNTRRSVCHKEG
jgi:hypothetical protein